jgi:hypothetical protein
MGLFRLGPAEWFQILAAATCSVSLLAWEGQAVFARSICTLYFEESFLFR